MARRADGLENTRPGSLSPTLQAALKENPTLASNRFIAAFVSELGLENKETVPW